jgi:mevalonate kinase
MIEETRNRSTRNFSGKLLLIGEHSVLDGSKALVIPYPEVSSVLSIHPGPLKGKEHASNLVLLEFTSWLRDNTDPGLPKLDTARMFADIEQGLYLQSSIPEGYGMGSSGALCAAVYDEYGRNKIQISGNTDPDHLQEVRKTLATMESFFHGTSSGIDPLCIYINKPVVMEGNEKLRVWQNERLRKTGLHAFLMDTGITGNTGELVKAFRNKLQGQSLRESFMDQYIPLVNEVVDQFVEGQPDYDSLVQLSIFQWRIFHDMIPRRFWEVWEYGYDWEYYTCKLLGSGGGGYILGFTQDFDYASQCLLERFNLKPIHLPIW